MLAEIIREKLDFRQSTNVAHEVKSVFSSVSHGQQLVIIDSSVNTRCSWDS